MQLAFDIAYNAEARLKDNKTGLKYYKLYKAALEKSIEEYRQENELMAESPEKKLEGLNRHIKNLETNQPVNHEDLGIKNFSIEDYKKMKEQIEKEKKAKEATEPIHINLQR